MYINYELLITALICYVAGSIPFGLFISIIFNKGDPRHLGSKNIGATNVLRLGGWRLGLFTLILDILKAFIPIKLVIMYNYHYVGISILMVIIGHLYPIWLGFKGGKGIATFIGILLAYNHDYFLIFLITWIFSAFLFKYSSLSALIATLVNLVVIIKLDSNYSYFILISVLIFIKHSENMRRLFLGNEKKIILKKKK